MKMLKKLRHSVMGLSLAVALIAPVTAQASAWICLCEITEEYLICVCFFDAEYEEN